MTEALTIFVFFLVLNKEKKTKETRKKSKQNHCTLR